MHPIQVSVYLYISNYFQWFLYYIARHIYWYFSTNSGLVCTLRLLDTYAAKSKNLRHLDILAWNAASLGLAVGFRFDSEIIDSCACLKFFSCSEWFQLISSIIEYTKNDITYLKKKSKTWNVMTQNVMILALLGGD